MKTKYIFGNVIINMITRKTHRILYFIRTVHIDFDYHKNT